MKALGMLNEIVAGRTVTVRTFSGEASRAVSTKSPANASTKSRRIRRRGACRGLDVAWAGLP